MTLIGFVVIHHRASALPLSRWGTKTSTKDCYTSPGAIQRWSSLDVVNSANCVPARLNSWYRGMTPREHTCLGVAPKSTRLPCDRLAADSHRFLLCETRCAH